MIIQRDEFLKNLAQACGRPLRIKPAPMPKPVNDYPSTRFADLTPDELEAMFIETASGMLAPTTKTVSADAASTVLGVVERLGSPVLVSDHPALRALKVVERLEKACGARLWDPADPSGTLQAVRAAETGVVYADYALADCGFMVLFSSPEQGRGASLLPRKTVFVVNKSRIVPRAARHAQAGKRLPSCINLIGGPSSTADIELIKVVGVHGPTTAEYVIVEDL